MSEPRHRGPEVPPLIWGVLGILVVAVFVLALGILHGG
jgi:hypothetical protein